MRCRVEVALAFPTWEAVIAHCRGAVGGSVASCSGSAIGTHRAGSLEFTITNRRLPGNSFTRPSLMKRQFGIRSGLERGTKESPEPVSSR